MYRLYVRLDEETAEKLFSEAEREHRTPQDQAATLIEKALGLRKPRACDQPRVPTTAGDARGI